jgi:hypothetical protein
MLGELLVADGFCEEWIGGGGGGVRFVERQLLVCLWVIVGSDCGTVVVGVVVVVATWI